MVRNGIDGLVVPPRDPQALADAVINLLKDDKLKTRMKTNIVEVAQRCCWDNIAKMHIAVYEEVLKKKMDLNPCHLLL